MIYNLLPKFHMKHEGLLFYGLRQSDEGTDTDILYFSWPFDTSNKINHIRDWDGFSCQYGHYDCWPKVMYFEIM